MNRKVFMQQLGAAALLASLGISLESCQNEEQVTPDDPNEPDPNSNTLTFDITSGEFRVLQNEDAWLLHPDQNILLVNISGTIHALSSVCTHSGCADNWAYSAPTFTCTCHGSQFTNLGAVTRGPAGRDLRKYDVSRAGDVVTIKL